MKKYLINYRDDDIIIFKILKKTEDYVVGTAVVLDLHRKNVKFNNYLALGINYINTFKSFSMSKHKVISPLAEVAEKMDCINNRVVFHKILEIL